MKIDFFKKFHLVFSVIIAACIVITLLYNGSAPVGGTKNSPVSLDSGWTLTTTDGHSSATSLPVSARGPQAQSAELTHPFPAEYRTGDSLCLMVYTSPFSVYLDDELLYEYGHEAARDGYLSMGSGYHFIALPPTGDTIRIAFDPLPRTVGFILSRAEIMPGDSFWPFFVQEHCFTVLCSALLFSIFVYVLISRGSRPQKSNGFGSYSLAAIALCAATWIMSRSGLLQLFVNDLLLINAIDFISFFLLPLPVLYFVRQQTQKKRIISLDLLIPAGLLFFMTASVLHFLRIVDFAQILPVFHVLLVIDIVCMIIPIFQKSLACPSVLKVGILILIGCGVAEFVLYFLFSFHFLKFSLLEIGLLAFTCCMLYLWIAESREIREQLNHQSALKRMAYTDELTGLENRTAFERRMSILSTMRDHPVCLIMLDLNGLKQINDTLGHAAGDRFIRNTANTLKVIVENSGQIFRIGGDEFVIFLECTDAESAAIIKRLEPYLRRSNESLAPGFSIGYAVFDPLKDQNMQAAFRRADKRMYQCKRKIYSMTKKRPITPS